MHQSNVSPTELVSADVVAEHLDTTVGAVRRWTREGVIPCYRPSPRIVRYRLAEVEAALRTGPSAQGVEND